MTFKLDKCYDCEYHEIDGMCVLKEYEWTHDRLDLSPFRWQPNDDGWWLHQVTSHTPNREEKRKAKR